MNWALKHTEAFQDEAGWVDMEDVKSRAVWASSVHWLPLEPSTMMETKQVWLRVRPALIH